MLFDIFPETSRSLTKQEDLVKRIEGAEFLFGTREYSVYNKDIQDIIDLVSLDKQKKANVVGSFKYRVHRYPGDLDLMEIYEGCCGIEATKNKIVERIKEIAQDIKKTRNIYLSEFKAGYDTRYMIDIGDYDYETNMIYDYDKPRIVKELNKLHEKKLIDDAKLNELLSYTDEETVSCTNTISIDNWKKLYEGLRLLYTVRWDINELIKGKKKLIGDKTLYLKDAISQNTIVKMDFFGEINNHFTEIEIFYVLLARKKNGEFVSLSIENLDYGERLEKDLIEKTYKEQYLKLSKRMWLYAIYTNNIEASKKLYLLFDSPAAIFYQIGSEAETLSNMMEILHTLPLHKILRQIYDFKMRLSTVSNIAMSNDTRAILYNTIDCIYNSNNKKYRIKLLNKLSEMLLDMANLYAYIYLEDIGFIKGE